MKIKRVTYSNGRIEEFECYCGEGNISLCSNCLIRTIKPDEALPLQSPQEKKARELKAEDKARTREERRKKRAEKRKARGNDALRKILGG